MRIDRIAKKIQKAVEDEERTGQLAEALRKIAKQSGVNPTEQDTRGAVDFLREYVQHVPHYLEQGYAAAGNLGLGNQMNQMGRELEAYWMKEEDVIPDRYGLMGIMDDAYASLTLLQGLSDYCRAASGHPLLQQDLTLANQAVRNMIGEPLASTLDQMVGITVGQALLQQVVGQLGANAGFNFGGGPDPYWGNASIDEIVTARLGAMGVV